MINAKAVKELRDLTGAGMMDCKKALVATNGNTEEAVKWLREKGIMKAAKRESRIAAEGICKYIIDKDEAVIYEVNCETDFVARNEKFRGIVFQIGNALLKAKTSDDREALAALCGDGTVKDLLIEATATIGEKISLRRVHYFRKESDRIFGAYLHMGGKIAVLCVLKGGDDVIAKDVCMHIAAMKPKYTDQSKVDEAFIASEKEILRKETLNEGKPAAIVDRIVEGKFNKMLKEICLVNQEFVKNPDLTVGEYLKQHQAEIIEYVRLETGEGIEKKQNAD